MIIITSADGNAGREFVGVAVCVCVCVYTCSVRMIDVCEYMYVFGMYHMCARQHTHMQVCVLRVSMCTCVFTCTDSTTTVYMCVHTDVCVYLRIHR